MTRGRPRTVIGTFGEVHLTDIGGHYRALTRYRDMDGRLRKVTAESGSETPKIWQAKAGSPSEPVDDFNLETRALLDEQIAQRTSEFIARKAADETPFFTYVCFTQVHPPLIHHSDFTGASGGGNYSDTLTELDHRTGQVLDAIEEAGVADNTIVVWSSDNPAGRANYMGGSNKPWRGHFASGFEGGMRVPAVLRWPGKVPAGAVTEERSSRQWTGSRPWHR